MTQKNYKLWPKNVDKKENKMEICSMYKKVYESNKRKLK